MRLHRDAPGSRGRRILRQQDGSSMLNQYINIYDGMAQGAGSARVPDAIVLEGSPDVPSLRRKLVQRFQGTTPIGRICPCMCGSSQNLVGMSGFMKAMYLDLPAAERVSPGGRLAFRQSACRDFDRSPARALVPALVAFQLAEAALSRRKEC
jgi:hypothetical protein